MLDYDMLWIIPILGKVGLMNLKYSLKERDFKCCLVGCGQIMLNRVY